MNLISFAIRILNRLSKQNGLIKRLSQGDGRRNIALEISGNGSDVINTALLGRYASGNRQGNANYPVEMGQTRRGVEIQNGQWGALQGNDILAPLHQTEFGCGALAHD